LIELDQNMIILARIVTEIATTLDGIALSFFIGPRRG